MCVTRVTVTRVTLCPPKEITKLGHLINRINICYASRVFVRDCKADYISMHQLCCMKKVANSVCKMHDFLSQNLRIVTFFDVLF